MKRSLTVAALVLTIFVLGIITGLLLPRPWFFNGLEAGVVPLPRMEMERNEGRPDRFEEKSPRLDEGRIMKAVIRRLELSEEQQAPFKAVLEKQRAEMRESMSVVREATKAKIDSINVEIDKEMAGILNERQLAIWKRFKKQIDRRGPR